MRFGLFWKMIGWLSEKWLVWMKVCDARFNQSQNEVHPITKRGSPNHKTRFNQSQNVAQQITKRGSTNHKTWLNKS